MNTPEIISLTQKYIMNTYGRHPIAFVRGEGCYLWDAEGKKYLDFLTGIAVDGLGHCHPAFVKAISEQANQIVHTSNLFYIQAQAEIGQLLCDHSFADKVFFCNSGAEANEAAVKLARVYQKKKKGDGCFEIITMQNSFHGRTLAMIAATGQEKVKKGFEPLPEGFSHVPFDDLHFLEKAMNDKTCAVMVEPIQGEGGVRIPSSDYLAGVRQLCQKHQALLIYDEVQTGMGRTGKLFAYEHVKVAPDILTVAKSLGAGFPIGACLASDEVANAFVPGSHASTFGGNFLACAAAKAFLQILLQNHFLENVEEMGKYFLNQLHQLKKKHSFIEEVRGQGLMIGIDLSIPGKAIVEKGLQAGLILNSPQEKTLRILPPLIVKQKEIDEAIQIMDKLFEDFA